MREVRCQQHNTHEKKKKEKLRSQSASNNDFNAEEERELWADKEREFQVERDTGVNVLDKLLGTFQQLGHPL